MEMTLNLHKNINLLVLCGKRYNRLCGIVVTVLGYRSGGPDSIPGTTRISEKYWVWNGVQLRSYLIEK
jgi:hypothetical protein